MLTADRDQIRRIAKMILKPGQVTELRALDVSTDGGPYVHMVSGYFNDVDALVAEAVRLSPIAKGVYIIPNPVNPVLLARASNRARRLHRSDSCTCDTDVVARLWLLIDCDPIRPSGISSTDAEHNAALAKVDQIRNALAAEGWPEPICGDSGNGGHLLYHVDLVLDDGGLIQRCLKALAFRFGDETVEVDEGVYNASRPCKLYGTLARKGDSTTDRPHRISRVLRVPKVTEVVPSHVLERLASSIPEEPTLHMRSAPNAGDFDLDQWVEAHQVPVTAPRPWGNQGRKWVFPVCPWNREHTNHAAYIIQFTNGAIAAGCHHSSCTGKGWPDLRKLYEPDTYDQTQAQEQRSITSLALESCKSIKTFQLADAIALNAYFARDVGGELYVYHGGRYSPYGRRYVREHVKEVLVEWGRPDQWSLYRAREVEGYILADCAQLWDRPPMDKVNVLNGLLDVRTGESQPHTPDHLSPVQLPVFFDPRAECPAWETLCHEVFPEDCADTLPWELAALLMTPYTSLQKAVLFLGEGNNGKSTFLDALRSFIGARNCTSKTLHSIESNRFALAGLIGKLANICPDLPAKYLEGTTNFKAIVGEDDIEAEYKHIQDTVTCKLFTRLIFSANSPPQSPDSTEGFFRKWLVVPFTRKFEGERRIPKDKLVARLTTEKELSGLMNRALLALSTVLERGITESWSIQEAGQEFREVTDPVTVWFNQACVEYPDAFVPKGDLLVAYNADCRRNGRAVTNSTAFGLALKRARPGIHDAQKTVGGKVVWCWTGIRMKDKIH